MDAAEKSLLLKMIEGLPSGDKNDQGQTPYVPDFIKEPTEYAEKLRKRKSLLEQKYNFNVGDIVVWKDGLKNKRVPEYGQPGIILAKHTPPLKDDDEAIYYEELDITIGFISDEDEFLAYNYDSNRFMVIK